MTENRIFERMLDFDKWSSITPTESFGMTERGVTKKKRRRRKLSVY